MKLSLSEIKNGSEFEDLVTSYFNAAVVDHKEIKSVYVNQSGVGADGGSDILVQLEFFDLVSKFKRIWVVQCKFHQRSIGLTHISGVNIPTLIHSYKANGYLLVCKSKPTVQLQQTFDRLNKNCIHGYQYLIWSGPYIVSELLKYRDLQKQYFPAYFKSLLQK